MQSWPAVDVQSGSLTGITPGVKVTFHIYSARATSVTVTPFAYDGAWRATFGTNAALKIGWNTVTFVLPSSMSGVHGLGLQLNNTSAWGGELDIDAVTTG